MPWRGREQAPPAAAPKGYGCGISEAAPFPGAKLITFAADGRAEAVYLEG